MTLHSDYTPVPMVSVIISHINSSRTIENCLAHLEQVDYPPERYEVIVVDAGSTDGSKEIVQKLSGRGIRQVLKEGCTESEGQSIGVQDSKGEVIMFTNSDIYVPRDWITKHVEWQRKGYDLVGGVVFWGGDKFSHTWNQPLPKRPYPSMKPGMGLGFSNCSIDRKFYVKTGGLLNLSSQHDAEFAIRSIRMGGRLIMDPAIEVYHDHPFKSFFGNFKHSFGYAINHVTVLKASFGKLVAGSRTPVMPPIGSVLKELALINVAQVYAQTHPRAQKWNVPITTSFFEFAAIRVFSNKLGQLCGVIAGAIGSKRFSDLKQLHSSKSHYASMTYLVKQSNGNRAHQAFSLMMRGSMRGTKNLCV